MNQLSVSMEIRLLRKLSSMRKPVRLDWFSEIQQRSIVEMNHHSFVKIVDGNIEVSAKGRKAARQRQ